MTVCAYPWIQCGYPTLQPLTAAEIPSTPVVPDDIVLSSAVSVTNAAGLQAMTPGNHYSIDADIDLAGVAWTPLDFNSTSEIVIEGNGHTISNLLATSMNGTNKGFIGSIEGTGGGQIRNLKFSNCSVSGARAVGVFCGYFAPDATDFHVKNITLTDCTVTQYGTVGGQSEHAGVLIGMGGTNQSCISGCSAVDCTVYSEDSTTSESEYLGGLIGSISEKTTDTISSIVNCTVSGGTMYLRAAKTGFCGGLIGMIAYPSETATRLVNVHGCTSSMDIVYTAPAGAVSYIAGPIGGLFGQTQSAAITSCSATGNLTFTSSGAWKKTDDYQWIGGFVGEDTRHNTYVDCSSSGTITFENNGDTPYLHEIGGFGGRFFEDAQLLRCYSTSAIIVNTVVGDNASIGGFAGRFDCETLSTTVSRCWCEGDITFNNTINSGTISTTGYGKIGGFIGHINSIDDAAMADVHNCYSWSSIVCNGTYASNLTFSGFCSSWDDYADLSFVNCYCAQTDTDAKPGSGYTGQIPAGADSQGFGGSTAWCTSDNVTATAIYYDKETSSLETSQIGEAETTEWLQTQANFTAAGWDFDTIWDSLCCFPPVSGAGQIILVEEL